MPLLEDLVTEYQDRGLSREQAVRAILKEIEDLEPRRRPPRPPSPREVVEQIAEIAPQPPVPPPGGTNFAKITPGGVSTPMGWRPPTITPVGFHRGYWTGQAGEVLTLFRYGLAVNEWDVSTVEGQKRAVSESVEFVKKWPIQAEKSVYTGGRR